MGREIQQKGRGNDGKEMYKEDSRMPWRPAEKSPWSITGIWKAAEELYPVEKKKYDRLSGEFDHHIWRGILVHWQV